MLPYHVGVLEELLKAGAYVPGTTPTAGTSGGGVIAMTTTTGTHPAPEADGSLSVLVLQHYAVGPAAAASRCPVYTARRL